MPPVTEKDGLYRDEVYQSFKGLDTTSSVTNIEPGYLLVADNCDITKSGSLIKRDGYAPFSDIWTKAAIRNAMEYVNFSLASTRLLWAVETNGLTGTLGALDGSNVASDTQTLLSTNRPSLLAFKNRFFFFNGVINKYGKDTTFTDNVGFAGPASAPTGASNTNGSLVVGASYKAAYTYYNSTTGDETSPSPLSAAVVVGADPNDGITWTVSASSNAEYDIIRLYRTVANGSDLFLDNTTASSNTSITSTQADSGLSTSIELDNTPLSTWGYPRYVDIANNRLVATGFSSTPNRVRVSKIGQSGSMPCSWQIREFTDCISSRGVNDANIGVGVANDLPIILKRGSVGRVVQLGSIAGDLGVSTAVLEYREISKAVTAVGHWATCNVLNNFVWLGYDNVYMTDGTTVFPVADKVSKDIKTFNFKYPEKLSAFNDTANRRIYITLIDGDAATEPNLVLVGHYKDFPEFYWTYYAPGTDTGTHPGISAGCFAEFVDSTTNASFVIFGNADGSNYLYEMNSGTADGAYQDMGIYFDVVSPPSSYGSPEEHKLFTKDVIYARSSETDYSINAYSVYDLGNPDDESEDAQSLSLFPAEGARWDVDFWDVDVFASSNTLRLSHDSHRKAYHKQLRISNTNVDEPVEILGWTIMARPSSFK